VLELRDAVDYEIVGEGLKTGYRDGIAADILRPGYAASGVAATSLEITRRSRLSRGRSNRLRIHTLLRSRTPRVASMHHGRQSVDLRQCIARMAFVYFLWHRWWKVLIGAGSPDADERADLRCVGSAGGKCGTVLEVSEPTSCASPCSHHSTRGPASRAEMGRQWRKAAVSFSRLMQLAPVLIRSR
jgi:hypothetical protein